MATLREAADAPELNAAWQHIQADFRVAFDRRNRYYAGKFGLWETLRSGGVSKLVAEAEAEVERLHGMLRSIDNIRRVARNAADAEDTANHSLTEGNENHG